jgi:glycosyltransferase involved in cell wall biosynthesis
MKILIDAKNLALYKGGISHWLGHQLEHWFAVAKGQAEFILLYPKGNGLNAIHLLDSEHQTISWPEFLPRKLRHIWYDNISFPRAIREIKPHLIFSPYHDVCLPRQGSQIYSVITVHDLCFLDAPQAYPWFIRTYYLWMLRLNLGRASHVVTISESTRDRLIEQYRLPQRMISIVPNSIETDFLEKVPSAAQQQAWRNQFGRSTEKIVLYSSGIDHRKNISRLMVAFRNLWAQGHQTILCITGNLDPRWQNLFSQEEIDKGQVRFLGFLSLAELRLAYQSADLVVYPSLCEGFGRACIESMVCGTPLACSDLPVFHEVAGDYAVYFDPYDSESIAQSMVFCLGRGRKEPRQDSRYELDYVQSKFIQTMDQLLANAKALVDAPN